MEVDLLHHVPIGIFGTVWAYLRLKEVSVRASGQEFDYLGSVLYCVGLSVILLALTIGDPTSNADAIPLPVDRRFHLCGGCLH